MICVFDVFYLFSFFQHLRLSFVVWWLGSRVVSLLDSGAEGSGSNHSRNAVLGKLFTPIGLLFTKLQNW